MTLSRRDFNRQCAEFVKQQSDYGTWSVMRKCEDGRVVEVPNSKLDANLESDEELLLGNSQLCLIDDEDQINSYEYSVVYSQSYQVPVMYFCVSNQDGCPVPLERIVRSRCDKLLQVVNQVEHPLLFRPFYMIHPCRTEDIMKTINQPHTEGYLVSWLSLVRQFIPDLELNIEPNGTNNGDI